MFRGSSLLLFVLLMLAIGCQKSEDKTTSSNVAIVDMQQIARAVGFDQALNQQLTQFNQQVGQRLQQLQSSIRSQLELKQKELGQKPTRDQLAEFQKLSAQLDNQYRQELSKAQQESDQFHTTLVGQFRQKVDPIIQSVAKDHGLDIVISLSESIVMVSPEADITADVLTWLKQLEQSSLLPSEANPAPPSESSLNPATDTLTTQPDQEGEKIQLQGNLPVD
ncbi:MAG: OmpH family outer membrane protein [Phycisphaeraceae bacterium]|nr:OmpH family outer membrane protein [Phycisphaeraceae bacterium]